MKTYKVNYKLQAVSSATKPIQLVLSLNTKWKGKYLYQICSIGKSVLPAEWDSKRNIPRKADIAGKLLEVKETIENSLNKTDAAYLEDESIYELFKKGYFKQQCEEVIKEKIQNIVTPLAEYLNKNYKWQELQREELYEEIKEKIKSSNFSLVNAENKKVNLDWFFNLDIVPPAVQFDESAVQPIQSGEYAQTDPLIPQ